MFFLLFDPERSRKLDKQAVPSEKSSVQLVLSPIFQ